MRPFVNEYPSLSTKLPPKPLVKSGLVVHHSSKTPSMLFSGLMDHYQATTSNKPVITLTGGQRRELKRQLKEELFAEDKHKMNGLEFLQRFEQFLKSENKSQIKLFDFYYSLFPDKSRTVDTDKVNQAFDKLAQLGCVVLNKNGENLFGNYLLQLSDVGHDILSQGSRTLDNNDILPEIDWRAELNGDDSSKLVVTPRMALIWVLTTPQKNNLTGWDILGRVHTAQKNRSFISRAWTSKITSDQLAKLFLDTDPKKIAALLEPLVRTGLLTVENKNPKDPAMQHWQLTPYAKKLVTFENVSQACDVDSEDLQDLILFQMKELCIEESQKVKQLKEREESIKAAEATLSKREATLTTDEKAMIAQYEQLKNIQNTEELEQMEFNAARTLQRNNTLAEMLSGEKALIAQLKTQLKETRLMFQSWSKNAHLQLRKMHEAIIRLQSAHFLHESIEAYNLLKEDGTGYANNNKPDVNETVARDALAREALMEQAYERFFKTGANLPESEAQSLLESLAITQKLDLEEGVAELIKRKTSS